MAEYAFGMSIFIVVSIVVSVLLHKKQINYILACILSSIISSMTYQLLGVIFMGYLDPFFIIAFIHTTIIAFIIAIIVGIPFLYVRRKKKNNVERGGRP